MSVLNLLSYNVHRAHSLFRKRSVSSEIHDLISRYNADLICLQEVWRSERWSASRLEALCAEGWGHASYLQSVAFPNGSQGNAILSRWPILEESTLDLSVPGHEPRMALCCRVGTASMHSRGLWIICVHLGLKRRERLQQWQLLSQALQSLPADDSILLAGDWNDWDLQLHQRISKSGFQEAFDALHGRLPRSFPSFAPLLKLDRVYSRHLNVLRAQINGYGRQGWPSDHLAYFAAFKLS